jgi:hypothetical protein
MEQIIAANQSLLRKKNEEIEEKLVVIRILAKAVQAVQEENTKLRREVENLKFRTDREG